MSAAALVPVNASLYVVASDLTAYLDTLEMTAPESPERKDCETAIAQYFQEFLPAKADNVAGMLHHLEAQAEFAALEIRRLQALKHCFERAYERLEGYTIRALEQLPEPKKGARKIEGKHNILSLRPSDRALVRDEPSIPVAYKTACVEMPAPVWEELVSLKPDVTLQLSKQDLKVRLEDVKKALKAGAEVPGADLEYRNNLVCK